MKVRLFLMMSIIAIGMMACKNNEDLATVADIAGNYEGYSLASCAYFQDRCTDGELINVSDNGDGSAKVTFASQQWGEFIVAKAQMTEEEGVYRLSGNGKVEMGMGENISSYDFTFSSTIKSTNDAQMQFSVAGVMGGLTIDFATGEAPNTEE